jgi:hypothetical protein
MKRTLFCMLIATLASTAVTALNGPYTSADSRLARIDQSYRNLEFIGNDRFDVWCLEYSTDGFLYGVDPYPDTFLRIDPNTGTGTVVGPLGVTMGPPGWVDLAEDEFGQLWMLGSGALYTIDHTTGAATFQCQAATVELAGLTFLDGRMLTTAYQPNPPNPGCGLEIFGSFNNHLEAGPDGWIYGLRVIQLFQSSWNIVSRTDPSTGVSQELGRFYLREDHLNGLTFDPTEQPLPAVPTLARSGMMVFIILLVAAGALTLARARH